MKTSNALFLIDTNVWIDWLLGSRPGHEMAKSFFLAANDYDVNLAYAITSLKDIFFIIEHDCKANVRAQKGKVGVSEALAATEIAWACLGQVQALAVAVACDESDVWIASKHRVIHNDYEDNLVIAAAIRAQAKALVTNDEKLICHCPVAALCVSDATAYLQTLK